MSAPRTVSRVLFAALFGLGGLCTSLPAARAQGQEFDAGMLELFFQLGLPDTRGAKWVNAQIQEGIVQRIYLEGGTLSGNAWLIGEKGDGTVELITGLARRGTFFRLKGEMDEGDERWPSVTVEPADLDKDVAILKRALQSKSEEQLELNIMLPGLDEDRDFDFRQQPPEYQQSWKLGRLLILAAELQRNKREAEAREIAKLLFAKIPQPQVALDSAVSVIGDARLEVLNRGWISKGDRGAYAESLERLASELARGWNYRAAVVHLAKRIREAKPAPESKSPDAEEAAKLLLGLTEDEAEQLPLGRNWLVPGGVAAGGSSVEAMLAKLSADLAVKDPDGGTDESMSSGAMPEGPLKQFFGHKREAAAALAKLVNDGRFLRVMNDDSSGIISYSFDSNEDENAKTVKAYARLPRPMELGELAWKLLEPLLPLAERNLEKDARSAGALAWLAKIEGLSDEEVAWEAMRTSSGAQSDDFQNSLGFLVKNGSEETISKLREVFLDPAVWPSGRVEGLLPTLEAYLKRMNTEPAPFMEQVKATVKKAQESESDMYFPENPGARKDYVEEMRKHQAAQLASELKKLDQILNPTSLADVLQEFETKEDEELQTASEEILHAARRSPANEAEAQIFQAAARAAKPLLKQSLLMALWRIEFEPRTDLGEAGPVKATGGKPYDDATRAALLTLLADDSEFTLGYEGGSGQTVSAFTATTVAWPRLSSGAEETQWSELSEKAPQVYERAIVERARVIAQGGELPPIPSASRVGAERVAKLIADLGSLTAPALLEAAGKLPADEQLAVMEHLANAPEWPAAFLEAQWTIARVTGSAASKLGAESWKGRRFDRAMDDEVAASIDKLALNHSVVVRVVSSGVLAGINVDVMPNKTGTIDPEQVKHFNIRGLGKRATPEAMVYRMIQQGSRQDPRNRGFFAYPLWKDSSITKSWREEKPAATTEPQSPEPGRGRIIDDPSPFKKVWTEILEAKKPEAPFVLTWNTVQVKASNEPEASR